MEVIKISPRGYCHGVVSAVNIVTKAAHDDTLKKPIYVLGMIVHNENLVEAFNELGIITLEAKGKTRVDLLDEIDQGTVIFTAHGVSPEVYAKANLKGLHVIDATCSDVIKTHDIIRDHIKEGYDVIYIGKNNHPETEGCININKDKIHLVTNQNDVDSLNLSNKKLIITNQTTLSLWDVVKIIDKIKEKYPTATEINEICNATQIRQEAVADVKDVDLVIVVGDQASNNTKKLADVAEEIAKIKAIRVDSHLDLDIEMLKTIERVAVTSGASTPTRITNEVIKYLEQFDKNDASTWTKNKDKISVLPRIRTK